MMNSLIIEKFKLFDYLEIKNLSRINLIVGKNNVGKSTLLEALKLYASNASINDLLAILEDRGEVWKSEALPLEQQAAGHFLRNLFFDRNIPDIGATGIVIGSVDHQIHISTATRKYISDNEQLKINLKSSDNIDDLAEVVPILVLEQGGQRQTIFRLDQGLEEARGRSRLRSYSSKENEVNYIYQSVSTQKTPSRILDNLWNLKRLSLGDEVINALQFIDPKISGITFIDDASSPRERIGLAQIEGSDDLVPLKSMGDGINRLFEISVALINAQNGLLLIDEFENGLHWTVQPRIWDIIFQLAERLNVQVFATTHSRDCVQGFETAWKKYPELGAYIRLDQKDIGIRATEYTLETLSDSLEMDIETR